MKTDPNDSAFPFDPERNNGGLTKREYIAAVVLAGWAASPDGIVVETTPQDIADISVRCADALIAALNKTP
jgi:hypothetical protein